MTHERTIQLWPSGQMLTYRGDPCVPGAGRALRRRDEEWRDGTDEEWRQIDVCLRAEMYAARDVLCCDSPLVDDLLKQEIEGFEIDDLRNLYPDPIAWELEQCRDWLDDRGIIYPADDPFTLTREACTELLESTGTAAFDDEPIEDLRAAVIEQIDGGDLPDIDTWRDAVQASSEAAEVYEWWRVSSWLCDQLHAIGEVTIDNGYGHWWGRTCTGQDFIMDGTLQQIAERF